MPDMQQDAQSRGGQAVAEVKSSRRAFLRLGLIALAAPAIVRASSIMPVKAWDLQQPAVWRCDSCGATVWRGQAHMCSVTQESGAYPMLLDFGPRPGTLGAPLMILVRSRQERISVQERYGRIERISTAMNFPQSLGAA